MLVGSDFIGLPSPQTKGKISLEETIAQRRSRREFLDKALTLVQLSQILWSVQGITEKDGLKKTVPSAGALYPLEVYAVVGKEGVERLEAAVYHYLPLKHALEIHRFGDWRDKLAQAALGQFFLAKAPVSLVIAAEYERVTGKYSKRGKRYVYMEAGHAAENVYLQVESLRLGTVVVGAFDDQRVSLVLNLSQELKPLYLMPLGWPR